MISQKEALDLMKMVTQHITLSSDWTDGPPVALFRADGCWCVRYASGNWWHYSLKDRVWQDTPVVRTRSNRLSCPKGRCPLGNPPERICK